MQSRNHDQKSEEPYVAVAGQAGSLLHIWQTCPSIGSIFPAHIRLHALPELAKASKI